MTDPARRQQKHQDIIAAFEARTVRCAVCEGSAWEAGPALYALAPGEGKPIDMAFGPLWAFAPFVCRGCEHTILIRLDTIPAMVNAAD